MAETIHVRGEGGAVWEMDLPLQPDVAKRVAAGTLIRVNPDGSPAGEAADDTPPVDEPETGDQGDGDDPDVPPELKAFLAEPPPEPVKPAKATKATK